MPTRLPSCSLQRHSRFDDQDSNPKPHVLQSVIIGTRCELYESSKAAAVAHDTISHAVYDLGKFEPLAQDDL